MESAAFIKGPNVPDDSVLRQAGAFFAAMTLFLNSTFLKLQQVSGRGGWAVAITGPLTEPLFRWNPCGVTKQACSICKEDSSWGCLQVRKVTIVRFFSFRTVFGRLTECSKRNVARVQWLEAKRRDGRGGLAPGRSCGWCRAGANTRTAACFFRRPDFLLKMSILITYKVFFIYTEWGL